jgi:hypothetical protein
MAALKPQDLAVVLDLCRHGPPRPPYAQIAAELSMSVSEVHAAVSRAASAGLIHSAAVGNRPNLSSVEEFLLHGVKYAFPAERGEPSRGVLTAWAAEPIRGRIAIADELPPVWPYPEGGSRGIALEPLYKGAPKAALRDPAMYEYLALVDALRAGRARERKLAEELILARLRQPVHA